MSADTNNTPTPPEGIAPEFKDMDSFNRLINDVGYARYNYQKLLNREKEFTDMIPGAADTALYNSGAAAMHSVINAEELRPGDTVLCANAIYGTTKDCVNALKPGIRVIFFDSTNPEEFRELIRTQRPRLIVAESIANSKKMDVTPLKELGEAAAEATADYRGKLSPKTVLEKYLASRPDWQMSAGSRDILLACIEEFRNGNNPFAFRPAIRSLEQEAPTFTKRSLMEAVSQIAGHVLRVSRNRLSLVIDNTLPSPHLINPLKILEGMEVEKTIVESGTKHYLEGSNEITLGIAYSDNPETMKRLKKNRIDQGTYLQPSAQEKIPATITQRMPEIMKNHARNALTLAAMLDALPGFEVAHPNLPSHSQQELVNAMAPEGAVTIFYVRLPEGMTGEALMQKIKDAAGDAVGLGSSFGHRKTWLSNYGQDARTVRIAAGSESKEEFEKILAIFKKECGNA